MIDELTEKNAAWLEQMSRDHLTLAEGAERKQQARTLRFKSRQFARIATMLRKDADRITLLESRAKAREWQPIETAPEGVLVLVFWREADEIDSARYNFDCLEDGGWIEHDNSREHYLSVGGPSLGPGPKEKAPYTHWMPITAP